MEVIIKLDEHTIALAIKAYLESTHNVVGVTFDTREVTKGYGMAEHTERELVATATTK